jgi:carbon-monoxide dehydrogenase medium subunit
MKPAPFNYHAPASLDETLRILAELRDRGKVLAGGQSLVPAMNFRIARPENLVDINRLSELAYIREEGGFLRIGALARHQAFERPLNGGALGRLLPIVARHIAHVPIRNRGTFAGSLAHADPAAEWCSVAAALDAEILLHSRDGERRVQASEFFVGLFTTAVRPNELIVEVRLPLLDGNWRVGFAEFSRRAGDFAIALAVAAVQLKGNRIEAARIALGGVGDRPIRASAAEQLLMGRTLDEGTIAEAGEAAIAGLEPFADIHASSAYRRDLAAVMVRRALRQVGAP